MQISNLTKLLTFSLLINCSTATLAQEIPDGQCSLIVETLKYSDGGGERVDGLLRKVKTDTAKFGTAYNPYVFDAADDDTIFISLGIYSEGVGKLTENTVKSALGYKNAQCMTNAQVAEATGQITTVNSSQDQNLLCIVKSDTSFNRLDYEKIVESAKSIKVEGEGIELKTPYVMVRELDHGTFEDFGYWIGAELLVKNYKSRPRSDRFSPSMNQNTCIQKQESDYKFLTLIEFEKYVETQYNALRLAEEEKLQKEKREEAEQQRLTAELKESIPAPFNNITDDNVLRDAYGFMLGGDNGWNITQGYEIKDCKIRYTTNVLGVVRLDVTHDLNLYQWKSATVKFVELKPNFYVACSGDCLTQRAYTPDPQMQTSAKMFDGRRQAFIQFPISVTKERFEGALQDVAKQCSGSTSKY